MGGVLLDGGVMSASDEDAAFHLLEHSYGVPFDLGRATWVEMLDPSERGLVSEAEVFGALASLSDGASVDEIRTAIVGMVYPVDPAVELLTKLHERGWVTSLATNHMVEWVDLWRSRFPWFSELDNVVCSAAVGHRKPSREFFRVLSDTVDGPGAWFVDDRAANVRAAARAGFQAVLLRLGPTW